MVRVKDWDKDDDTNEFRQQRMNKFDRRLAKQSRQGGKDSKKKDRGFQRGGKEEKHEDFGR